MSNKDLEEIGHIIFNAVNEFEAKKLAIALITKREKLARIDELHWVYNEEKDDRVAYISEIKGRIKQLEA